MVRVFDVLSAIDQLAPWSHALPFDKVGLQVGDPNAEVSHVFVSLDRSLPMLELAAASGAQLVLSHHPLIWEPLKSAVLTETVGQSIAILNRNSMALAGVHTNWDVAKGGITETLGQRLGVTEMTPFGQAAPNSPLPLGRVGTLDRPVKLKELVQHVDHVLETKTMAWGDPEQIVTRIGLVGGAGDSEWRAAKAAGAEAFLTGEIAQHEALEGTQQGVAMLASGHFATEHPGCGALRDALADRFPTVAWTLYEPAPGMDGRPL
jgi:dinuclear metal center YbgI/SA1388 family protein